MAQQPQAADVPVVPEPLQAGLAGRYRIDRELGRGGMATVYLAHDLKHDRPVALKVFHPTLPGVLGPKRFLYEIRLAARLDHPHILSVHDSGDTAGYLWFTMPFVAGESLRQRLTRERQLPVDEVVRIGTEVARALDHAHREGIIHRDIKPENILLTREGDTLVADFGIARGLEAPSPETRLTEVGVVVGTPLYMSPEQAGGQELDGRTDVFSLGVVLYELLVGEPPFSGATPQDVVARRMSGEVPRPGRRRPDVPAHVEHAVVKALALSPAERHATAAAFARALASGCSVAPESLPVAVPAFSLRGRASARLPHAVSRSSRAAVTLALGFLLGVGVLFGWLHTHTRAAASGPKRLAVLPFDNLGDSADAYFADGVTDAVRGKLAGVPGLQVIAGASANDYKHTSKPPQQIARELDAAYLLVGRIRWQKGDGGVSRVEVSPELIDLTGTGAPTTRWQQPFDASLTDVFQVQADIAGRVAEALGVALGRAERERLGAPPTRSVAAYDAYLRGEELLKAGVQVEGLRAAVRAYEAAVALDPAFAAAWAQLSRAHAFLYGNGQITADDMEQARRAAERALALAPDGFEGHLALGDYYSYIAGDNARAFEQYALAQRSAPDNAQVLAAVALSEEGLGRWEASVAHLQRALTLDPRASRTAFGLGRALLWLRRYPEALEAQDRVLALVPTSLAGLEDKAMTYLAQGDLAHAQAVLGAAPPEVSPAELVAYVAQTCDLYWVLDERQKDLLRHLPPAEFDGNRATWGLALAGLQALAGDRAQARAYADSARLALQEQLRATPADAQLHALLGTALAFLGWREEAVREGERAVAMLPVSKDAYTGAYLQHQLVRIYLLTGEPERALDRLEPLLKLPYFLSPAWLRIDPTFAPLRGNPRFERLVAGT